MQIPFGQTNFPVGVDASGKARFATSTLVWDSNYVVNGHTLIMGYSGAGKTHTLRHMIKWMAKTYKPSAKTPQTLRIHIFDVHDDIETPEEVSSSDLILSESAGYGLNPLIVQPNRHSGGVRKTVVNFINIISKSGRVLGDRQEAVLREIMMELYEANGFYADNPSTWNIEGQTSRGFPRKHPTINDLYRFSLSKYKQMTIGGDSKSTSSLEALNKEIASVQRQAKNEPTGEPGNLSEKFKSLRMTAVKSYENYVMSIQTGRELESYLKYDNRQTIKSVVDRIDNLRSCGIFKDSGLPFDPTKTVWRYRIKHLGEEEKKMFVFFRLKELYEAALRRGVQDTICEVIVIDEAKKFMDSDPDNIIVKLVNEIRKFGTMVICASQSFTHFSDDFMTSTASKIILGVSDVDLEKTSKKIQMKKEILQVVKPKKMALIQIKQNLPDDHPLANSQGFWQPTRLAM